MPGGKSQRHCLPALEEKQPIVKKGELDEWNVRGTGRRPGRSIAKVGVISRDRLASGDGPHDQEGFLPRCDRLGERRIGVFVGEILFTGEEPQEGAPFLGHMITNGATEHGILSFESVEHRALGDRRLDAKNDIATHLRQGSQMGGQNNMDHERV